MQLEFKAMNKVPRPKLYFKHQDILDSTLLEPSTMSMYLHQNMPNFFGDIGDLADCLETYSLQDSVLANTEYSYAMQQEIYEGERLAALINTMALTETNLHCKEAAKQSSAHKSAFYQMQQPYYFEHIRTYKANKQNLQDAVKER